MFLIKTNLEGEVEVKTVNSVYSYIKHAKDAKNWNCHKDDKLTPIFVKLAPQMIDFDDRKPHAKTWSPKCNDDVTIAWSVFYEMCNLHTRPETAGIF